MKVTGSLTAVLTAALSLAACGDSAGTKAPAVALADGGAEGGDTFNTGDELKVVVPETGRVYVRLASVPSRASHSRKAPNR